MDENEPKSSHSSRFEKRNTTPYNDADIEAALREALADCGVKNAVDLPLDTKFTDIGDDIKKGKIIGEFRTKMGENSFKDAAYTKFDFSKTEALSGMINFMKMRLKEKLRYSPHEEPSR